MKFQMFKKLGILNKFMFQMIDIERTLNEIESLHPDPFDKASLETDYHLVFTIIRARVEIDVKERFRDPLKEEQESLVNTNEEQYFGIEKNEFINFTDKIIRKHLIAKAIYESFKISEDPESAPDQRVTILRPRLVGFFADRFVEKLDDLVYNDMNKFRLESSIISVCVCLETLANKMLNLIYQLLPSSNKIDDKSINFSQLSKLDSIENARQFLIDSELMKTFRQSFIDWYEEINTRLKVTTTFPECEVLICDINELFQRRNLYVHADGIVNNLYLQNCGGKFTKDLKVGDYLKPDISYIRSRWKAVTMLGWFLYYKFCIFIGSFLEDCVAADIDAHITDYILKYMKGNNDAIPAILKVKRKAQKEVYSDLVDQMNYFLYYRLNNKFDMIMEEVNSFNPGPYDLVFKMFMAILKEDPDALKLTKQYFENVTADDFFITYEWPVFKMVRDSEPFRDYFKERITQLFG